MGTVTGMQTRWLDDDEKRTWRRYLAATRMVEDALDRQLRSDADMPHSYYEVLVRLSGAPERSMRMSVLADQTRSSRSRLSHAVRKLEDLGWVERVACADDGRGQLARLTDEGVDALAAAAPGHVAEVRARIFDALSADQVAALDEACSAMLAAMGEDPEVAGEGPG